MFSVFEESVIHAGIKNFLPILLVVKKEPFFKVQYEVVRMEPFYKLHLNFDYMVRRIVNGNGQPFFNFRLRRTPGI